MFWQKCRVFAAGDKKIFPPSIKIRMPLSPVIIASPKPMEKGVHSLLSYLSHSKVLFWATQSPFHTQSPSPIVPTGPRPLPLLQWRSFRPPHATALLFNTASGSFSITVNPWMERKICNNDIPMPSQSCANCMWKLWGSLSHHMYTRYNKHPEEALQEEFWKEVLKTHTNPCTQGRTGLISRKKKPTQFLH